MSSAPARIAIAAGGTAGHVVPALAVADALRAEGAEVSFVGGERAEAELVPAAGYPLHRISVEGLSRSDPLLALRALVRAAAAVPRSRALLRTLAPDAVLGAGGYIAGPVGLAAVSLRIPLVLSEADSHLGLTNRLLAPFARRVCLAFAIGGREGPRYRVTGRPVAHVPCGRDAARVRFGIEPEEACVLVFGGSLGARSINLAAVDAFAGGETPAGLPARLRVLHVSGRRDHRELAELLHARGYQLPGVAGARPLGAPAAQPPGPGGGRRVAYDLREYLELADFHRALAAADLVVARAGGSVFEIAAHGLPAILVPYPHAAGDHQSANARWMVAAGAAVAIPDAQLTAARLGERVAALLGDRRRLAAMALAARGLARPDAARVVAAELLAAARP